MAITLDPATKIFTVPQSSLIWVQGTFWKADTNALKYEIQQLMDNEAYAWMEDPINHNSTVTVAGTTYARTLEIINGYSIVFSPDDQWSVRLDGSNNNFFDIESGVLNQNQVQVIPTNSAGLQDLSTMLASAYQGQVVIDTANGQAGTSTPIGTFFKPVNNMADALTIASENGIKDLIIANDITITEDLTGGYNLVGTSPYNVVTADPSANMTGVSITNLKVIGELDGLNEITHSHLDMVTNVSGYLDRCAFYNSMTLAGNILVTTCYSNVSGDATPEIVGGAGIIIQVRDYHGGLLVSGVVDGDHSIQGSGGALTIDSSCTGGGHIHVRGSWYEIYDNSGAGCEVFDQRDVGMTSTQATQLEELWQKEGFDPDNPATVTDDTSWTAAGWTILIGGSGTSRTLTRS